MKVVYDRILTPLTRRGEHRDAYKGHAKLCAMCDEGNDGDVRRYLARNKQSIDIEPHEFTAMLEAAANDTRRVMRRIIDDHPRLKTVRQDVSAKKVVAKALDSASEISNGEIGSMSLQDILRARPLKPFVVKWKTRACMLGIAGLSLEKYSDQDRVRIGATCLSLYGASHRGAIVSSIAERVLATKAIINEYGLPLSTTALSTILSHKRTLSDLISGGTFSRLIYACDKARSLPEEIRAENKLTIVLVGLHSSTTKEIDVFFDGLTRVPQSSPHVSSKISRGTPQKERELTDYEKTIAKILETHPAYRGSKNQTNLAEKVAFRLGHAITADKNQDLGPDRIFTICLSVAADPALKPDNMVGELDNRINKARYPMLPR